MGLGEDAPPEPIKIKAAFPSREAAFLLGNKSFSKNLLNLFFLELI